MSSGGFYQNTHWVEQMVWSVWSTSGQFIATSQCAHHARRSLENFRLVNSEYCTSVSQIFPDSLPGWFGQFLIFDSQPLPCCIASQPGLDQFQQVPRPCFWLCMTQKSFWITSKQLEKTNKQTLPIITLKTKKTHTSQYDVGLRFEDMPICQSCFRFQTRRWWVAASASPGFRSFVSQITGSQKISSRMCWFSSSRCCGVPQQMSI